MMNKEGNQSSPNMENNVMAMGAQSTSENIQIWHNALGHPGANMMDKLSRSGKIPSFQRADIAETTSKCRACNMAKARALPVLQESGNQAEKPMQRIHCNVVTRLPLTMSGKTGFSLIVDEYSKFVDV